ncbi:MAG: hypothetical protein RI885_2284 [Actinomycetota bacterium]|jgi:hypothetical protein
MEGLSRTVRAVLALTILASPVDAALRTISWTTPAQGRQVTSDCANPVPVTFPAGTQLMNLLELRSGTPTGPLVWTDSLTRSPGLPNTRQKDFPLGVSFLTIYCHTLGGTITWGCPAEVTVVVNPDTCVCPPVAPTAITVTKP